MGRGDNQLDAIEMKRESRSIWVAGLNRSGTKWVSNLLSNHNQVASIQHEIHGGILESPLIDIMPQVAGDLSIDREYERFVDVFARSDYCRLSPITPEELRALQPRPADTLEVQGIIGERLAKQAGQSMWLQKTSLFNAEACLGRFPDARVVLISRNIHDQLNTSVMRARQNGERPSVLRFVLVYVLGEKLQRVLQERENCISIRYEELQADTEAVTRRLCAHVNLPFDERMLEARFEKNTAFASDEQRRSNLSSWDRVLIATCYPLMKLLPLSLMLRLREFRAGEMSELPRVSQKLARGSGDHSRLS